MNTFRVAGRECKSGLVGAERAGRGRGGRALIHSGAASAVAALCCILLLLHLSGAAADVYVANMTGLDVVGYPAPVPETYEGTAVLRIQDTGRIDYVFTQTDLDEIQEVWLKEPVPGDPINGQTIFNFNLTRVQLAAFTENGSLSGFIDVDPYLAIGVTQRPYQFYISVKTSKYSQGAIKGFLRDTTPSPTTGLEPNWLIDTNMTAEEVVPKAGPENGYTTGLFSVFIQSNGSLYVEFDFMDLNFTGLTSVGLYTGKKGAKGTLVYDMTPHVNLPAFASNEFTAGAFVTTKEVLFPILSNFNQSYCQIASSGYPSGASRGQLHLVKVNLQSPPSDAPVGYLQDSPPPSGACRRREWEEWRLTLSVLSSCLLCLLGAPWLLG